MKRLDNIAAEGYIGSVNYASDYRITDTNHRMDWALIELDSGWPIKNLLPLDSRFRTRCFHGIPKYRVEEGDTVSGTSNCLRSKWYGKVGRSSGCTAAEHGAIKRAIA